MIIGKKYQVGELVGAGTWCWVFRGTEWALFQVQKAYEIREYDAPRYRYDGEPPVVPPEPKDGEWWMCQDSDGDIAPRLFQDGYWFNFTTEDGGPRSKVVGAEPFYRMEKAK